MEAGVEQLVDLGALSAAWQVRWGTCHPVGHLLLGAFRERWVRFHYLPGSKRYPDSEAEYRLLLQRQHTVLTDLDAPAELTVITCGWNTDDQTEPVDRSPELEAVAPGTYWRTVMEDDHLAPDFQVRTHLYAGRLANMTRILDPLLRAIADEVTIGVILAPPGLDWLVHPYDGGIDIITATVAERDELKGRHPDWLSSHRQGY